MRNVVVLIHGYGEHVFRDQYLRLTQFLRSVGWEVQNHIIREHWNGSDEQGSHSYYYDEFNDLLSDLTDQVTALAEEQEDTKILLIGKSLGGLLTIRFLEELDPVLSDSIVGGVALAPCLAIGAKYDAPLKRSLAYFVTNWLGFRRFYSPFDQLDPDDVTKKPEEYLADPHVLSRGIWASVAVTTRNETFLAHERADRLRKRLLIFHGRDDKICECSSSSDFAEKTAPYTQITLFENTAHDLLDESDLVVTEIHRQIETFMRSLVTDEL